MNFQVEKEYYVYIKCLWILKSYFSIFQSMHTLHTNKKAGTYRPSLYHLILTLEFPLLILHTYILQAYPARPQAEKHTFPCSLMLHKNQQCIYKILFFISSIHPSSSFYKTSIIHLLSIHTYMQFNPAPRKKRVVLNSFSSTAASPSPIHL
jgi:hypothetical protein